MSEQQPLLPVERSEASASHGATLTWREETSRILESRGLHKTVVALITIDATSVLIDLGYTLLSPGCNPTSPDAVAWMKVLSHISLAITTLFLVEIPMALWAFGPQYYHPFGQVPHAALHAFDALIIITTFVLEVALKGRERELASLLVVLRLWRLIKLIGGIAAGAGEIGEEDAEELAETRRDLERSRTHLSTVLDENQTLKRRLGIVESLPMQE